MKERVFFRVSDNVHDQLKIESEERRIKISELVREKIEKIIELESKVSNEEVKAFHKVLNSLLYVRDKTILTDEESLCLKIGIEAVKNFVFDDNGRVIVNNNCPKIAMTDKTKELFMKYVELKKFEIVSGK